MKIIKGKIKSNVEGTAGAAKPSKAVLVAGKDTGDLLREMVVAQWGDAEAQAIYSLLVTARLAGLTPSDTWERLSLVSQGANPADAKNLLGVVDIMAGSGTAWARKASAGSSSDGTSGTNMPPSAIWKWNGVTFDKERVANVDKTLGLTTLAASASGTIWTPASGKRFRLASLVVCASVTGRYAINDGATTIFDLKLVANTPFVLPLPANFILSDAINNALSIQNLTGGSADVSATATGNEE